MQRDIVHKWTFRNSPEEIWDHLTKSELLSQWLMENDFRPVVGHEFQFRAKPLPQFGFDGNIYCQVLEVIPNKRLSYTWKGGPGNGKISLDSVVIWTIAQNAGGTELVLEHKGFKGLRNYIPYLVMNKGWLKIGERIRQLLNSRFA